MTRARRYQSWGRLSPPSSAAVVLPGDPGELPDPGDGRSMLPFGNGRSYGDCCLNGRGTLLDTRRMDRIVAFDPNGGVARCAGGVLLGALLDAALPEGWFLPVTPGTKHVTVGGAIANDVHGKNHHRAGTFGAHVLRLELLRSDGSRTTCAPGDGSGLFEATVGGLGLTGLITWAEVQLVPVEGPWIDAESIRFGNLHDFFELSAESDAGFEHTVGWIDCLAGGRALGRGWLYRGNHWKGEAPPRRHPTRRRRSFFVDPPFSLVNALSLRAFNLLYYRRPAPRPGPVGYDSFFYPLDALENWNRMYGPRGFYQFQCVVPEQGGEGVVRALLEQTARDGQGSFLAVLKMFGDRPSPGLLSFPRPGPTLALDFPNRGSRTERLLDRLETIVAEAGGALYPAKDARMRPETFRRAYPSWEHLEALRDPALDSDFWRRVTRG